MNGFRGSAGTPKGGGSGTRGPKGSGDSHRKAGCPAGLQACRPAGHPPSRFGNPGTSAHATVPDESSRTAAGRSDAKQPNNKSASGRCKHPECATKDLVEQRYARGSCQSHFCRPRHRSSCKCCGSSLSTAAPRRRRRLSFPRASSGCGGSHAPRREAADTKSSSLYHLSGIAGDGRPCYSSAWTGAFVNSWTKATTSPCERDQFWRTSVLSDDVSWRTSAGRSSFATPSCLIASADVESGAM